MELIKRNIHMDRMKTEAVTQFALEDDVNLPENKPDIHTLNLEKGEVVIEEIKPGTDVVHVKGYLAYSVLYHTEESGCNLAVLEGRLPFEEKINMNGATPAEHVMVEGEVEDLTVGLINSRKLNLQTLITLTSGIREIYDEEVPVAVHGEERVEYRKVSLEPVQVAICKNDIFRLKEEVTLPANYPNIFQILWSTVSLGDMNFKPMEEKISISGDIHIFFLYEGEGEEHPVRSFETVLPFSGTMECHGCSEGMIPDVRWKIGQKELTVRPDLDGEERSVGLELVLDCAVRMYEEEALDIITDIYGVTSEVDTIMHEAEMRKLLSRVTGKTKVADRVQIKTGKVLQLLHSEGTVSPDHQEISENGIMLQGTMNLRTMYITGEDEDPYGCTEFQIPYQYMLEVPGITEGGFEIARPEIEQLQMTMLDSEEMDVKAVLSFNAVVFQKIPMSLISQVMVAPLDTAKKMSLPGMVIYSVKEGDNLWNIGRKYYVSVDKLRELNHLESDELTKGQKLLIVKGS